jgi:AraC-like DNA-binding protein
MVHTRRVLSLDGLEVADIACRHRRGRGVPEEASRHGVGFVRRGCFVRSGKNGEALLDPSTVFFVNPGDEQRYDHPHSGGDDCTAFLLDPELLASLWGGDPVLPVEPLHIPSRLDLEHRLLLAEADNRGASVDEIGERAILLLARILEHGDPLRPQSGRPMRGSPQRALIDDARESLAADTSQSLLELARSLAVSPHHLSRLFRAVTGHTLSRHRMRLRVRAALERLATESSTSHAWLPTSTSQIAATSAAPFATRQGRLRPPCAMPSESPATREKCRGMAWGQPRQCSAHPRQSVVRSQPHKGGEPARSVIVPLANCRTRCGGGSTSAPSLARRGPAACGRAGRSRPSRARGRARSSRTSGRRRHPTARTRSDPAPR